MQATTPSSNRPAQPPVSGNHTTAAAQAGSDGAPPLLAARFDPAYLQNPAPAYPKVSRRRGEEGKVMLRVRVLGDGRADTVEIAESSGHPRLDEAARETVRGWRFVPARTGDTSIDSWLRVPIVFRLEN
ncbi:energy transducer TonB [Aromatoleum diolicum]|uniref:TonB family protein n=1 Tax=Aromatoleum diolicum TaxID=75796 RepID=A0ABX1Q922_9RHOO|nr:energy transducer TonB [Aromatoleum diolicum]NMG74859.1 TonB family protein [Aromatoleum diolicum]